MAFTGFSKAGQNFFRELAARQDRDWFKGKKDEFTTLWEEPLQALLDEVSPAVARQYKGRAFEKPKIFRIYRDVRFSKDKAPFKTHVAAVLMLKGGHEAGAPAAMYVHLGLEDSAGAGHWTLLPGQLARFRKLVVDEKSGKELDRQVGAIEKKGFKVESFESLKRVPSGFDPGHPRARFLKMKGFGLTFPKIPARERFGPGLGRWLVTQSAISAPLVRWLEDRL